jgi:hypothetical protein
VNIFINYITDQKIHIVAMIWSETQYKSLTQERDDYAFKIQFLDLKSFLADGDLDRYATKFAETEENRKVYFLMNY